MQTRNCGSTRQDHIAHRPRLNLSALPNSIKPHPIPNNASSRNPNGTRCRTPAARRRAAEPEHRKSSREAHRRAGRDARRQPRLAGDVPGPPPAAAPPSARSDAETPAPVPGRRFRSPPDRTRRDLGRRFEEQDVAATRWRPWSVGFRPTTGAHHSDLVTHSRIPLTAAQHYRSVDESGARSFRRTAEQIRAWVRRAPPGPRPSTGRSPVVVRDARLAARRTPCRWGQRHGQAPTPAEQHSGS